ncbi:zinc knuckle (CCHC-type) family protein [Euphorbia peplus]|nr:zinc knuckle (CCHC-type) family protein [Euphorbia peplus]
MEPDIQLKIEQTVLDILKNADMANMTEFKLRVAASEKLGIELTDIPSKKVVRSVVESFLLSSAGANGNGRSANEKMVKDVDSEGNRVVCKLSKTRNVVIQDFNGKSYVSIREFYHKDGRQLPSNKGINLSEEQWSTFRKSVPSIEEAIAKMQSKLRSNIPEQNEQVPNLVTTSQAVNGQIPEAATSSGINGQASKSVNAPVPREPNTHVPELMTASTPHELNGEICDSAVSPTPCELVPIKMNRFSGKDYNYWAPMMELFLKQLNLAYVLTDPYPSFMIRPEASPQDIAQTKAAERKWFNDDYMCRHNILAYLSDALYKRYSITRSAKELWEELRLVYLHEEFGKKRSQVKSYIEFQITDDKPILEQIQELNNIADSVVAAGIHFDEKFHVGTIISKLPPSWKDFCMKLMCEEHLPFGRLMDYIRMEDEFRNCDRQIQPPNSASLSCSRNLEDPRTKEANKQRFTWKR